MITFDTLLIKFRQTAQLTFNGRTITEFFAVLFLFRCREKVRDPPNSPRSVICWDLFLYFLGHFGVTNGRHSRSALYCAENIRDQFFLKNFFFINNGRHRTTALYRFPRSIGPRYNGAAVYKHASHYQLKINLEYSTTLDKTSAFTTSFP